MFSLFKLFFKLKPASAAVVIFVIISGLGIDAHSKQACRNALTAVNSIHIETARRLGVPEAVLRKRLYTQDVQAIKQALLDGRSRPTTKNSIGFTIDSTRLNDTVHITVYQVQIYGVPMGESSKTFSSGFVKFNVALVAAIESLLENTHKVVLQFDSFINPRLLEALDERLVKHPDTIFYVAFDQSNYQLTFKP